MAIIKKYFGTIQLDNLGKAVRTVTGKVEKTEQYGHQIKVKAAMWDSGGITIDIWDNENKTSLKLGRLLLDTEYIPAHEEALNKSKIMNGADLIKRDVEEDLPF